MKFLLLFLFYFLYSETSAHCSAEDELNEKYAPLPAAVVRAPPIGPSGWYLETYGGGAYMVTDGSYQCMFFVSTVGVILVDAPPTIGKNIGYAIGNVTDKPITHIVYSHVHADHIGAAYLYTSQKRSVQIIAHQDTRLLLDMVNDPKRPNPTTLFTGNKTLTVGNQTLQLAYQGENHVRGNIFIYAPIQKTLMVVDVIYPGWIPFTSLGESTNVPGWIKAHDQILAYDFKYYIGGHVGRSGVRKDVLEQREYIQDLFNNCKAVILAGSSNDPTLGAGAIFGPVFANNPGNGWAAFRAYQDITAEACANKTNEKWLGRLGGADVFSFGNAGFMIESLRLDFHVLGPLQNE